MKDYFSMQYNSFLSEERLNTEDVAKLMEKFKFQQIDKTNISNHFAFKKPEGDYVTFGLYGDSFISSLNKRELESLEERYDVQNKLFSNYENVIFHGILENDRLCIFCVINIDSKFCLGMYETSNLVSKLGFNFVSVVYEKVLINEEFSDDLVITQRHGLEFPQKTFMLTKKI